MNGDHNTSLKFQKIPIIRAKNKKTPSSLQLKGVFWGNQWGSNPRPLEPQSNALTN